MRLLLVAALMLWSGDSMSLGLGSVTRSKAKGGAAVCTAGSKSDFVTGSQSWNVPAGCSTIQIDLRGSGGGGGGGENEQDDGQGGYECPGGSYGGGGNGNGFYYPFNTAFAYGVDNVWIKRGTTVLAQAKTGAGGGPAIGGGSPPYGAAGTSVSTGLTLTAAGGSAGGAGGAGIGCAGAAGAAGDKVTGQLSVTGGETLTVLVSSGAGRGYGYDNHGTNGTAGSVSITWP